ncbi:MAG: hypothetical protein R3C18_24450 [Planctomycetaceae bacterium]
MRSFVLLASTLVLVGCGGGPSDAPTLVPATGTVYVNDEPIMGANVTFQVAGAPLATGTTNAEGKFVMTTGGRPGAPLGDAKVGIAKVTAQQQDTVNMTPDDMRNMQMDNNGTTPGLTEEIPQKYGNPASSGLTATLSTDGAQNDFEFRLVK